MPIVKTTSCRVLVAEDDATVAHMVRNLLKQSGHECVIACDGFEALKKVCVEVFDLVVSASGMPVMTGVEFARRMRLLTWYKTTPLIFLTDSRFELTEHWLVDELSLAAVVQKPFGPSSLDQVVTHTLAQTTGPALYAAYSSEATAESISI